MKPLLSFGEALVDFLQVGFANAEEEHPEFRQFPGGAPAKEVRSQSIAALRQADQLNYDILIDYLVGRNGDR